MKKTLREMFQGAASDGSILKVLIENQIRALMRETPGDAQYVELIGSMVLAGKDPPNAYEVDVPMTIVAHNYPGHDEDVELFNAATSHRLTIEADGFNTRWNPSSPDIGDRGGASVAEPEYWDVIAVDGYQIEDDDAAKIKAYLKSRPDILSGVMNALTQDYREHADEEGPPEPGEWD